MAFSADTVVGLLLVKFGSSACDDEIFVGQVSMQIEYPNSQLVLRPIYLLAASRNRKKPPSTKIECCQGSTEKMSIVFPEIVGMLSF